MKTEIEKILETKMDKTINVLKEEMNHIRAGRANPKILDRISLEYYGALTPLKQLAGIAVPEPRMLTITPYDMTILQDIEKAIHASDLGLNPTNDGKMIRLVIPMLTEREVKTCLKMLKKLVKTGK